MLRKQPSTPSSRPRRAARTRTRVNRSETQGPYVSTHKRHFLLQCWYRVEEGRHVFVSHQDVSGPIWNEQDVRIKLKIPRTDRMKALAELHDYNITRFSLFQSEEALADTLAYVVLDVREGAER